VEYRSESAGGKAMGFAREQALTPELLFLQGRRNGGIEFGFPQQPLRKPSM